MSVKQILIFGPQIGNMIQRIQSLWLLLATAATFFSIKLPFYSGLYKELTSQINLTGQSTFLILLFSVITGVLTIVAIFLFKKRKLQLKIGLGSLIMSFITILLYFLEVKKYNSGVYALSMLIILSVPIFILLALRSIYKDEKLVKSLDRLRP